MIALQRRQQEPGVNIKALLWTIGVHALLLLLFVLLHYNIVNAPPTAGGEGLEVNLGSSDNGSGNDQPKKKDKPSEYQAVMVYKTTTPSGGIAISRTSTDPTDPSIDSANSTKPLDSSNKENAPTQPPQPRYAYAGETGKGGNSADSNTKGTNEGTGHTPGDQGVPGGTPGAKNYTGTPGNGTGGIGHNLGGRQITPDKFEAEFSESGKVVIHVTVDRNGNIVNKRIISSSSQQLSKIAMEKLAATRFSKSESGEPQQFGDVTIVFKTR